LQPLEKYALNMGGMTKIRMYCTTLAMLLLIYQPKPLKASLLPLAKKKA